jgi:Ca-activated chloride channel homolog
MARSPGSLFERLAGRGSANGRFVALISFALFLTLQLFDRSAFLRRVALALPSRGIPNSHLVEKTQEPLRVSSDLVKIGASVADSHGVYVGGFGQTDFRVLIDGHETPIVFFTVAEEPARILVLVETSPAVYLMQNQHLAAAYALLEGLSPEDEVALCTYDSAPRAILPFTPNKPALAQALAGIQYTLGSGELNFYGSLAEVLAWLSGVEGKKAAVLLTTGLDSSGPSLWNLLAAKMQTSDTVIYPVALGGILRGYSGNKKKTQEKKAAPDSAGQEQSVDDSNPLSFAKSTTALKAIAAATGGRAYFPSSPNDFVPDYREIASALRHQYLIGIAPLHDGRVHLITVELTRQSLEPVKKGSKPAPPAFTLYARSGYLAPLP